MAYSLDDVPDQSGKTIIITGASSGIGLEATKILCAKGAHVVMACRNISKSEPLAEEITTKGPGTATVIRMDTTDLDSIDEFVSKFEDLNVSHLTGLVLNAGIMMVNYKTVPTRSDEYPEIESQMACNVVGHFYLAVKLQPLIVTSTGIRIVTVASGAANSTSAQDSIDYDVFLMKTPEKYNEINSYAQSKLGNLLLAYEMQRRFNDNGIHASAVPAHPGYSRTPLIERIQVWYAKALIYMISMFSMSAEGGGLVLAIAATVNLEADRKDIYFTPSGFMALSGAPIDNGQMPVQGRDADQAKKLWECCEKLCNIQSSI